jgi:hypothetical protein
LIVVETCLVPSINIESIYYHLTRRI